jgi:hypothetical protein
MFIKFNIRQTETSFRQFLVGIHILKLSDNKLMSRIVTMFLILTYRNVT